MKYRKYGPTSIALSLLVSIVFLVGHQYFQNANIQNKAQPAQNPDRIIAIFGLLLVGGQVGIAARQAGISRQQNVILAEQTRIIDRQAKIADQTYIATHRPRLIVRSVYLERNRTTEENPMPGYSVHYLLANVGGSKATIIAGGFACHKWKRTFRPFITDIDVAHFPLPAVLEAGESVEELVPIDLTREELNQVLVTFELQKMNKPGVFEYELVLRGGVVYADDNGIKRRTAIWRTCIGAPSLRMSPSDDTDYEYAD